ncbi:MAG: hypothetical protein KUG76_00475 [Gammaproteobacteria bacterium]|nr:hypothetical protein [Gammaproteobacteria bacterium]
MNIRQNNFVFLFFSLFLFEINVCYAASPQLAAPSTPISADEADDLDSLMGDFDSAEQNFIQVSAKREQYKPSEISGNISYFNSYTLSSWKPYPGSVPNEKYWASSKIRANLKLKYHFSENLFLKLNGHAFRDNIYEEHGRFKYSQEFLDENENEIKTDEFFIRYSATPRVSITAGKQIVVWGTSDNLRVVDVINPLDNRELGIDDIENIRLASNMLKVDVQMDDWMFSGMVITEPEPDQNPVFGSPYYVFPEKLPAFSSPRSERGKYAFEYALSISGKITDIDVHGYIASIYNNQAHLELDLQTGNASRHLAKLNMFGVTGTTGRGNWVYKSELAYFDGFKFMNTQDAELARTDAMFGLEFYGLTDASLAFEVAYKKILNFNNMIESSPEMAQETEQNFAIRFNGDYLHNSLHILVLAMASGSVGSDGNIIRLVADYDIRDAVTLTLGGVLFGGGESLVFQQLSGNDQIFAKAKFSF